jgi:hypothetical protein
MPTTMHKCIFCGLVHDEKQGAVDCEAGHQALIDKIHAHWSKSLIALSDIRFNRDVPKDAPVSLTPCFLTMKPTLTWQDEGICLAFSLKSVDLSHLGLYELDLKAVFHSEEDIEVALLSVDPILPQLQGTFSIFFSETKYSCAVNRMTIYKMDTSTSMLHREIIARLMRAQEIKQLQEEQD